MGEFTSPWLTWVPRNPHVEKNTGERGTDKTDKSPPGATSVSFVSASRGLNQPDDTSGCGLADTCVMCSARAVAWGSDGGAWCTACWEVRVGADGALPTLPARAELTDDERRRLRAEADDGNQLARLVLQAVAYTPDPAAWLLYSRRLDRELWVARDAAAAAHLDRDGARGGLPVVLAADLEQLRSFDDRRLNDLLDVPTLFPGARLAQLEPEAAS
jgi:hypothetical protein